LAGCIGVFIQSYDKNNKSKRSLHLQEKHNPSSSHSHSQPTVQEAKLLAEELQKLFVKTSGNGSPGAGNDNDKRRKGPKTEIDPNSTRIQPSKLPSDKVLSSVPNHSYSSSDRNEDELTRNDDSGSNRDSGTAASSDSDKVEKEVEGTLPTSQTHRLKGTKIVEEESTPILNTGEGQNDFHPTHWNLNPSINPSLHQKTHHQMNNTNLVHGATHHSVLTSPKVLLMSRENHYQTDTSSLVSSSSRSDLGSNLPDNAKQLRRQDSSNYVSHSQHSEDESQDQSMKWNNEEPYGEDVSLDDYEEDYLLEADEREEDEETSGSDPLKEMVNIFQVVNSMYKFGPEAANFTGLLKVDYQF
jgi:hypothetical protein